MTQCVEEAGEATVLARITEALGAVLGDCAPDPGAVTLQTRFVEDLDLESIDLVVLTGELRAVYGERVDFPGYFASLELSEIIGLTVGHLVRHIVESLEPLR